MSSAESSPSASPASSRHGSYNSRLSPRREHSYTHVFPANSSAAPRNKPRKTALMSGTDTKQRDLNTRGLNTRTSAAQLDQSDRTRHFFSGLDWLLEATSSSWGPMPGKADVGTPLTEGALRKLHAQRKDSCFATEAGSDESESKS